MWKVLLKALPNLTPSQPETWWSEGLGPCSGYCGFLLDHSLYRAYLFNLGYIILLTPDSERPLSPLWLPVASGR